MSVVIERSAVGTHHVRGACGLLSAHVQRPNCSAPPKILRPGSVTPSAAETTDVARCRAPAQNNLRTTGQHLSVNLHVSPGDNVRMVPLAHCCRGVLRTRTTRLEPARQGIS